MNGPVRLGIALGWLILLCCLAGGAGMAAGAPRPAHKGGSMPVPGTSVPRLRLQTGHYGRVEVVAFSPDGGLVATGGDDWTVRIWDLRSGDLRQVLPVDGSWQIRLAFSPDGAALAIFLHGGRVLLTEARTGRLLRTLENGAEPGAIAYSENGRLLACGSVDDSVTLWNPATGARLRSIRTHQDAVEVAVLSPDGALLACASGRHGRQPALVELFSTATGELKRTFIAGQSVHDIAFSSDGRSLAFGCGSWPSAGPQRAEVWDVAAGTRRQVLEGRGEDITSVAFSPDGRSLASLDRGGIVRRWDLATGAGVGPWGQRRPLSGGSVSPDGRLAAVWRDDGGIRLLETQTGSPAGMLPGRPYRFRALAFSPGGDRIFAAGSRWGNRETLAEVVSWDTRTGQWCGLFREGKEQLRTVAVSPDGKLLAAGGEGGGVRLWDVSTGERIAVLGERSQRVFALSFSPNGQQLAVAGQRPSSSGAPLRSGTGITFNDAEPRDGLLEIWDVPSRTLKRDFSHRGEMILRAAFTADGTKLLTTGYRMDLDEWDLATGNFRKLPLPGVVSPAQYSAFAAAGTAVAVAGARTTLQVWDLGTKKQRPAYAASPEASRSLALSADGKRVAAAASNRLSIWDERAGRRAYRTDGSAPVDEMTFSPDGAVLAVLHGDNSITLWDTTRLRCRATLVLLASGLTDCEWIAYTPQGHYAASAGAAAYIRWMDGPAAFPESRFRDRFRRPEEVQKSLAGAPQPRLYETLQRQEAQLRTRLVVSQSGALPPSPASNAPATPDRLLRRALSTQGLLGRGEAQTQVAVEVRKQLAAGADPNTSGVWGTTSLMFMAAAGDVEGMKDLLRRGVPLDTKDDDGKTCLHWAAQSEQRQVFRLLLDAGAELKDATGRSLLHLKGAALNQALVDALRRPNDEEDFGIPSRETDTAWMLLELGADPNVEDARHLSLLFSAPPPFLLRSLLDKGADPNPRDAEGCTPLISFARAGQLEQVQLMLAHRANPDAATRQGWTALIYAAQNGHGEVVRLLLAKGADPKPPTEDGRTALILAVSGGHLEITRLLLQSLPETRDVNATDSQGWSALTYAVIRTDPAMIRLLLSRKASLTVRTREGKTLMEILQRVDPTDRFGVVALLRPGS